MIRFLWRRLLETLVSLLFLSFLIFALFQVIPGDYLTEMEANPAVPREQVEALRRSYGLDQPFYLQYSRWMLGVLRGELGYSFAQQRPAAVLIQERLQGTVTLTFSAFLLILVSSVPLALLAARHAGTWLDRAALLLSLVGLSLPTVLASLLFLYLAFWTGWFPIGGSGSLLHLVLPSLTLALPSIAFFMRTLRLELIESLRQPYILGAAARGLPGYRIFYHALRNSLNPLISLMGLTFGGLLSGSVVVEKVFNWPGLGSLVVDSILARDLYVALNCVLAGAVLVIAANLVADLLLAYNDPRIRYQ